MTDDSRSFFVSQDGSSTSTTIPTLGHTEFRCHECGHPWRFGQSNCSKCNSMVFDEHVVAPSVVERVAGKIRAVAVPAKPTAPRATAEQTAALRRLQGSATTLLADLRSADVDLRAAVVGDVEELQPAQGVVHQAVSIDGDASWDRVAGLSLALRAFAASLSRAIDYIEEPK